MKSTPLSVVCLLFVCVYSQGLMASQPNVVVILTDDQGWGDLSVNGNANIATPNIDSLARDGATLSNFYVCQVCAPTRAEFLTGRYYPRTGVSGVSSGQGRMNADRNPDAVRKILQVLFEHIVAGVIAAPTKKLSQNGQSRKPAIPQ